MFILPSTYIPVQRINFSNIAEKKTPAFLACSARNAGVRSWRREVPLVLLSLSVEEERPHLQQCQRTRYTDIWHSKNEHHEREQYSGPGDNPYYHCLSFWA
jgi:hypothetical protein